MKRAGWYGVFKEDGTKLVDKPLAPRLIAVFESETDAREYAQNDYVKQTVAEVDVVTVMRVTREEV